MRDIIKTFVFALVMVLPKISFALDKYIIEASKVDSIVALKYHDKKIVLRKTIISKDSIECIVNTYINRNKSAYIIKAICSDGIIVYLKNDQKKSIGISGKYINPNTAGWFKMRKNLIGYVWGH